MFGLHRLGFRTWNYGPGSEVQKSRRIGTKLD